MNVPEALRDRITPEALNASESFKAWREQLHGAKFTQEQFDVATAAMLERGIAQQAAAPQLAAAECVAELRQADGWRTDAEYKANVTHAFNAVQSLFGKDAAAADARYGNDPMFIRAMAQIGREMAEDRPPSGEALVQMTDTLESAMADPAYTNPRDPRHQQVVARVRALETQMVGTRPVVGKSMSFKSG